MYVRPTLLHRKGSLSYPDYHDTLLVDDEAFSRSKKYFLAISTLKVLDVSIPENITQIKRLVNTEGGGLAETDPKVLENLTVYRQSIQARLNELETMAQKFRGKIEEVVYLRDGLFNASAVMETQASTRLNQNLRLLTFVSIFFLPLSFCMSVWSINNQLFSLSSLAVVITCVALVTYFAVFNLDRLIYRYQYLHGKFVRSTVRKMKLEKREPWTARANPYEKFLNTKETEHPPSNWMLVQYRIQKLLIRPSVQQAYDSFIKNTIRAMKKDRSQRCVDRGEALEKAQVPKANGEKTGGQSNWWLLEYKLVTIWGRFWIPSIILHTLRGRRSPNLSTSNHLGGTIA
ncbi:hypothetical protein OCU04_001229 [Sclerotinia nivalis]|uniref:Uncharacterized protein n=1 Tax=Sclerotinia nivalis TaxID=352851 RepID=A0A9X0AYB1_9HELO|nr:hypothetical protein OCU04_001229 [Sclerotinia nivalis]